MLAHCLIGDIRLSVFEKVKFLLLYCCLCIYVFFMVSYTHS